MSVERCQEKYENLFIEKGLENYESKCCKNNCKTQKDNNIIFKYHNKNITKDEYKTYKNQTYKMRHPIN